MLINPGVLVRLKGLDRLRPDGFVLALACIVALATVLPCRGIGAEIVHALGVIGICCLFFLQGARLSREAVLCSLTEWRLHAAIAGATFLLFPLMGLALSNMLPGLFPSSLWLGILFVCALPTTIQSSVAFTSIAQGNVPGAICSSAASNVVGIVLTPLVFGMISRVHGGGLNVSGVVHIVAELLVPFIVGHALRPRIGGWMTRNRRVLSLTDRVSILLVVYGAFSAAVVHGVWHVLPPATMGLLLVVLVLLLTTILLILAGVSRAMNFSRPDEIALVLCGSQKSVVSGVPIANVLFSGASVGPALIPIMIYYPLEVLICAWVARCYATASTAPDAASSSAIMPATGHAAVVHLVPGVAGPGSAEAG